MCESKVVTPRLRLKNEYNFSGRQDSPKNNKNIISYIFDANQISNRNYLFFYQASLLTPKLPKRHQSQDRTDNLTLCQAIPLCIPIL